MFPKVTGVNFALNVPLEINRTWQYCIGTH